MLLKFREHVIGLALLCFGIFPAIAADFDYFSEQVADLKILRFRIPSFEKLSFKDKMLSYHLSKAARAGWEITYDQNYKHNLTIRRIIEQVVLNYQKDRESDTFKKFMVYAKRVWFSNGIHHHYSNDKILPDFSEHEFREIIAQSPSDNYPLLPNEDVLALIERIIPILFDPNVAPKKVCKDENVDIVKASAVNFYQDVNQEEVKSFFESIMIEGDREPISYGLNSKKIKSDGQVTERIYKVGGLYSEAIQKIIVSLEHALIYTENEAQKEALEKLIEFYKTGDLRIFNQYNIAWIKDDKSLIDTINGFIEVYDDPLGHTGTFEAVVSVRDEELTGKYEVIGHEAQWFENMSPIFPEHRRDNVKGVSYKIVNVIQESGGASPSTPIGINLPNADWIRKNHGSKSVSLGNIIDAYEKASSGLMLEEFYLPKQWPALKEYGSIADKLHTGLHEVVGHASGQLEENVLPPHQTLKQYASTLEEGRADLVALYYIGDQKLVDIGVSPTTKIIEAAYDDYITNGLLVQLARLELGKNIEEDHMRNRQMIAKWVLQNGRDENIIERKDIESNDGKIKTYFVINDYQKLRVLFGELLREVQRIKSQGDFEAGKNLVEGYGVYVDKELHAQVKARYESYGIAPYSGFINPSLKPVKDTEGNIIDISVIYPRDFTEQMMEYGRKYSYLPHYPQ